MANNNDLSNSENILVKVDQNNLIYVDPNSIVNSNGEIQERGLKQENLVMYVNLEADIIPRTTLVADNNQGNTLLSIAKGNLNFLKNQTGDGNFDATWTDTFLPKPIQGQESTYKTGNDFTFTDSQFKDPSAQTFGIDSITIAVKGANFVPQVSITFIDVRGKTLFDNAENSPYNAFFHLPWPIFYLTVKGYYGKAIRYRLHMTKFTSKFDESNGNFEVSTTFVGSTFAYLNDISLSSIINSPYMFMTENYSPVTLNTNLNVYEKKVTRGSRGYAILKSIYKEYERKGLVPKGFPVKTLKDLGYVAESLDKILEEQVFSNVSMDVFQGLKEVEDLIDNFETSIKSWSQVNLSSETYIKTIKDVKGVESTENWFYLSPTKNKDRTSTEWITGATKNGTLELNIKLYSDQLSKSVLFTQSITNKTRGNFQKILLKKVKDINSYYEKDPNGLVIVGIDKLFEDIFELRKSYEEQRKKVEDDVERIMNEVIKKPELLGFEPTIRNIFAVVLANAEVYIRLMKEVHNKAFEAAETRYKLIGGLTKETKGDKTIYPWPEIKKPTSGKQQNVIAYPGEPELINKLKSNNANLWPEVEFIEDYISIVTGRDESNVKNEPTRNNTRYLFETDADSNKIEDLFGIDVINETLPYTDTSYSSFVYELYERAKYITLLDSFNQNFLNLLADEEGKNILESIKEDIDLLDFVKKLNTKTDLIDFQKSVPLTDSNGVPKLDSDGKPMTSTSFTGYLPGLSPYDKFNYFKDHLPTTDYIVNALDQPFKLENYNVKAPKQGDLNEDALNKELINYEPEDYRLNIYPFNSNTYLSYLGQSTFKRENLKFDGLLNVDSSQGFITSFANSKSWVKNGYQNNLFNQLLTIQNTAQFLPYIAPTTTTVHLLNTPYFHNQLLSDFGKTNKYAKYTGSAYLLLNSLPFLDLDDQISYSKGAPFATKSILMSSLFREVASTHFVPYHLLLKWGSIYHRYKKYIIDGTDILDGCIDGSNLTQIINGSDFFDNSSNLTFTITPRVNDTTGTTVSVTHLNQNNVGVSPFYQSVYNQIVNGFVHYNGTTTDYSGKTDGGYILHRNRQRDNLNNWDVIVDNTKYFNMNDPLVAANNTNYTLLPSNGNVFTIPNGEVFGPTEQKSFKTLWFTNDVINGDLSGKTFPSYSEYIRSTGNTFSIDTNQKKVIDLIATFSPKILEQFEDLFLEFATETQNAEMPYEPFPMVNLPKFQNILKSLSIVPKETTDSSDINLLLNSLTTKQLKNAEYVTSQILSNSNLIKFTLANPKEIDSYILYGMSKSDPLINYAVQSFDVLDVTPTNLNFIKLYIGEDIDSYYLNFFAVNNIKLTEENIISYRPMAQIYGGYIKAGGTNTATAFSNYLKTSILERVVPAEFKNSSDGANNRLTSFLNQVLKKISSHDAVQANNTSNRIRQYNGYNTNNVKLEMYNTFKSFNDKWTAGNSIGQRLLLEEFLFLDKANRDIGDKFYLNLDRILPLLDPKNSKVSLYSAISMLIQGTGLDMRALPAYVNFYGTNVSTKSKILPSKSVAKNLFGTFLEVDYQESSPKIIIQLVGNTSKRPDMSNSKPYKFSDDSFYLGSVNNNPLVITSLESFSKNDLTKSNKVVAFEVSFGDQNQGIFKGVQLDQSSIKNTSESFQVLENLNRSQSGAGAYNVDVGLFDYYKQASYKCEVSCMGNVMIQPTMFFYLKNIPMFRGSYWITEVNHNIKGNVINTTFTGTRIPYTSLPDPKDSFVSSYRVLFDKISSKARAILKQRANNDTTTDEVIIYNNISYVTDRQNKPIQGEKIVVEAGITKYGISYNGYNEQRLIQKVENNGETWLRTTVVRMGGTGYTINDGATMNIANGIEWSKIKDSKYKFYSTTFKLSKILNEANIREVVTTFKNPKNGKTTVLNPSYQLDSSLGTIVANGPVNIGPNSTTYGMGMSNELMTELGLYDGDVVYFKM